MISARLVYVEKPVPASFASKYASCFAPVFAYLASFAVSAFTGFRGERLALLSLFALAVAMWVVRNREAAVPSLATIAFGVFYFLARITSTHGVLPPEKVPDLFEETTRVAFLFSLVASLLMMAATEMFRRSIVYGVSEDGVFIVGGLIRKQEHYMPYHMIGRVIVERGLLARWLGYGTVILVSPAAWGEEFYARAVALGGGRGGSLAYSRILQEVSRDPLKALYGIRQFKKVAEYIEQRITVPFKAYEYTLRHFGGNGSDEP